MLGVAIRRLHGSRHRAAGLPAGSLLESFKRAGVQG
jgi:hypothetical protein